jgi:hypothetical protein
MLDFFRTNLQLRHTIAYETGNFFEVAGYTQWRLTQICIYKVYYRTQARSGTKAANKKKEENLSGHRDSPKVIRILL